MEQFDFIAGEYVGAFKQFTVQLPDGSFYKFGYFVSKNYSNKEAEEAMEEAEKLVNKFCEREVKRIFER